mmetsp:Transcript_17288/g.39890  ORF Transcript_17288/g.39890 Transcript_17288/m.39890 type:complete len:301 (-) Transcript_17288:803-1705(-)
MRPGPRRGVSPDCGERYGARLDTHPGCGRLPPRKAPRRRSPHPSLAVAGAGPLFQEHLARPLGKRQGKAPILRNPRPRQRGVPHPRPVVFHRPVGGPLPVEGLHIPQHGQALLVQQVHQGDALDRPRPRRHGRPRVLLPLDRRVAADARKAHHAARGGDLRPRGHPARLGAAAVAAQEPRLLPEHRHGRDLLVRPLREHHAGRQAHVCRPHHPPPPRQGGQGLLGGGGRQGGQRQAVGARQGGEGRVQREDDPVESAVQARGGGVRGGGGAGDPHARPRWQGGGGCRQGAAVAVAPYCER